MTKKKRSGRKPVSSPPFFSQESEWAVARLSGGGDFIDVRFKVSQKMAGANQLYLLDEASGKKATVGAVPKIGRLMTHDPDVGNVAFILFRNPDDVIKAGSLVTLVVGDYKKEHIPVQ